MSKENNMLEGFLPIKDYEDYLISRNGEVYSTKTKRMLSMAVTCGYLSFDVSKNDLPKRFLLHRVLAITFIPNPHNYPNVKHIDGNKLNNAIENLIWAPAKYQYDISEVTFTNKCNAIYDETVLRNAISYFGFKFTRKIIEISLSNKGYPWFCNDGKYYSIHVLIGMYIYKNKDSSLNYHHIDENKLNSSIENIQQLTRAEHMRLHTKGKKRSDEARLKMSSYRKGRRLKSKKHILMTKDGVVIREYDSTVSAALDNNISATSINNNLKGRSQLCKGYKFIYK